MAWGCASQAWVSALLAGVLSFASPKESSQRKGDPRVGALRVPCATRQSRGLRNSGYALKQCSPFFRARLRCSAPLMGTPKASTLSRSAPKTDSHGQPEKTAKNETHPSSSPPALLLPLTRGRPGGGLLSSPLRGAEQRRGWRIKGEDCLRAKPEFRSPRQSRVAQGTGEAGTDPGSPSFCLLFLGEARKSETPRKGGTPCQSKPQNAKSRTPKENKPCFH
jgi:hypothetical protein